MAKADRQRDKQITREIHRLFWRAQWQDPLGLILNYVLRLTAVAAYNIFIPLVSAYAIQSIIERDMQKVDRYALMILGLALVYCVSWAIGETAISKNGVISSSYVQKTIFSNLLQKDYEFYGSTYFGSLGAQVSRLRDAFHRYAFLVTLAIPKQIIITVASVGVIAWQSPALAGVTLIMMFFVLSFTMLSSQWRIKFRRKVAESSSVVAGAVGDALTHGATVKSFSSEDYEERRFAVSLAVWARTQFKSWTTAWPADVGRMALAAIAATVLLLFSARAYIDGSITITVVILIQLYVIKLVASTLDIAEIVKSYEEAMGMAYEPIKTMSIQPTVLDPKNPKALPNDRCRLELKDVSYRYSEVQKNRHAIRNLSIDIAPGEKIGIVGYSGSGKTTLTKLLLRFMDVAGGSVSINGVDIRDVRQHDLRKHISYVTQEPLLFHRSIWDNISYGRPEASEKEVLMAARAAYVDEFAKELPDGYYTMVGERGVKLSGGQRQRVTIARAILRNAPILVLDEATSALDSRSEQLIQKALWKLMKDRTALVIAHRLSTIQRMDRIAVMDKGKIVQLGTHDELLKDKSGIYAELWAHQSGGYVGAPTQYELPDGVTT